MEKFRLSEGMMLAFFGIEVEVLRQVRGTR